MTSEPRTAAAELAAADRSAPRSAPAPRRRVRIRYRKEGDLRWLGHQDLVRVWDRLLRRSEVQVAQSEGFHRRPRINFPSALAVGISGLDEVMEMELAVDREPVDLVAALALHLPPGLSIASVERMDDGARFTQPASAVYEISIPDDRRNDVEQRLNEFRATPTSADPPDASPVVLGLELVDGVLRMHLRLGTAGAIRPRDLLTRLGLADLEATGIPLMRTRVEVGG